MNKKTDKGFTLIELLVVIAIIGILASVVLASLNSARAKGKDAAIKAQLSSMRAEAELFYDFQAVNTYLGVCSDNGSGPNPFKLYDAALVQSSQTGAGCDDQAGDKWAAIVPLNTGGFYCTDSTGYVGTDYTSAAGGFCNTP